MLNVSLFKTQKLGDILIQEHKIDARQLEFALAESKKSNIRLGEAIINLRFLSEDEILDALSVQFNIRKVSLSKIALDPTVISHIIPENAARKFKIVPLGLSDNMLTIALSDPLNIAATDMLEKFAEKKGYEIEIVLAKEFEINKTIDYVYLAKSAPISTVEIDVTSSRPFSYDSDGGVGDTESRNVQFYSFAKPLSQEDYESQKNANEQQIPDSNIIEIVNNIIITAVKNRASDIHVEPLKEHLIVRERIDGELFETNRFSISILNAVISRIKIMANMDIAERRIPQDSRIDMTIEDKELDMRISVIPTVKGEKAVFRILDKASKMFKISEQSTDPKYKSDVLKLIHKKYGLFLITGPTGSGKTTTAYSVINELNTPNKNIITVEDPVEYIVEYLNQIEVNRKGGVSFPGALRSVLRQDPDIILVGEIRDEETARIAVQAALTGHFVISTLHTQDASNTISRLVDMGIEPFLLSSAITGIIGQRLIKKLCDNCKKPYKPDSQVIADLGLPVDEDYTFYKEEGCMMCNKTGFHGRIGIMELLIPSDNIKRLIMERADAGQIRNSAIIEDGFLTLRRVGLKEVIKGVTTLEEVLTATQDI